MAAVSVTSTVRMEGRRWRCCNSERIQGARSGTVREVAERFTDTGMSNPDRRDLGVERFAHDPFGQPVDESGALGQRDEDPGGDPPVAI